MGHKLFFLRLPVFVLILIGLVSICATENVKKSIDDNRDDTGEGSDDSKDESLDIPVESEANNNNASFTCSRRAMTSKKHEILIAQARQFPFMAAVMSHQNEYLCSGSVISNGLIVTTAKCTLQPISHVLLNATKDKKDEFAALLHVIKTEKFPTYTGSESLKDVGLIYTEKHNNSIASKIRLSNYTSGAEVTEVEGIGYGLNAETGQPKELQYIGMDSRMVEGLEGDILRAYFDCIDTKVLTCFKDTGGPVISDNQLLGIVIEGQDECTKEMTSTYAVSKKMASFLPIYTFKAWLEEKIKKNEDNEENPLEIYPLRPKAILRHKTVSVEYDILAGGTARTSTITYIFVFSLILPVL